jgi:hypothetical protein
LKTRLRVRFSLFLSPFLPLCHEMDPTFWTETMRTDIETDDRSAPMIDGNVSLQHEHASARRKSLTQLEQRRKPQAWEDAWNSMDAPAPAPPPASGVANGDRGSFSFQSLWQR